MGLILVASRDTAEVETIKAALSVHGWWVTVAPDRETALQAAADQAPKLVLVDHELPESIELVRGFGSSNGGPGVLACVPEDFDGALELKEAGVDELITKPLNPPGLLEVVRRCLSAPRPAEPERPAAPKSLLTTEEIFGDVLRELGEDAPSPAPPAPPVASPAPPQPSPTAAAAFEPLPSPPPVATAAAEPLEAEAKPVVSLAGLFDDDEAEPAVPPAVATAPPEREPEPEPEAAWDGEERRASDRPWNEATASGSPSPAVDELFASVEGELEHESDSEGTTRADEDEFDTVEAQAVTRDSLPPPPLAETAFASEPVDATDSEQAGRPARRVPTFALVVGGLAAALLVVAGVLFFRNSGSESVTNPIRAGEAVDGATAGATESSPEGSAGLLEPPAAAAPAESDSSAPPATTDGPAATVAAPIEQLDLEAIVEQELTRREEELRQVFLEEEKRLLRELNKLDESSAESGDGGQAESDSGG